MERLSIESIKYLKSSLHVGTLPIMANDIIKAFDELIEYKKLEEQNRLLKLPCAVEDKVFVIVGKDISKQTVKKIIIREDSVNIESNKRIFNKICFGKTVFLTKEDAEAALKELERGKGEWN